MTHSLSTSPLDGEYELITRLIEHSPDVDPAQQVVTLLAALGELSATLNAPDAGPERWSLAAYDLCTVVTVATALASCFDITPHRAAVWPDGTRVGVDGDLVTAAGWVADWVREPPSSGKTWLSAVPVTELLARAWCLADRLALRDVLRAALRRELPAGPPAAVPCP